MSSSELKLVVVGDGAVGKTCLLMAYCNGTFSDDYIPTVFEKFSVRINVKGEDCKIQLHDTSGQEDYDRLRPLAYPQTDIFLVCFSVVMPNSFENAKNRWQPELKHYCPEVPFILVGTQIDLREDLEFVNNLKEEPVTQKEGEKLAKKIGAIKYLECSAKSNINVKTLFKNAIIMVLAKPEKVKNKPCVLL